MDSMQRKIRQVQRMAATTQPLQPVVACLAGFCAPGFIPPNTLAAPGHSLGYMSP
jgi:hypothetical protein